MDKCKGAYNPSKVSMYIDSQKNKTLMDNYYTIDEINDILDGKIDLDSVYTKDETYNRGELYTREEVEYLLSLKANKVDVYSKIDMNTLLDLKANKNEIYDKNEIDEILGSYYTKIEIDTILENKADIEDVIAISGQVLTNIEDISDLYINKADKATTLSGYGITDAEPAIVKLTAFNKNFGTTAGTVSEGNHAHTFASLTNKPNTLSGYGITDVPSDNKTYGRLNGDWTQIDTSGGGGASIIPITWSALKSLRDARTLVPGQSYRITDYVCTTITTDSQAVNNLFDIIVIALDESHLSENASATYHEGDTYFAYANLEAWEIKYCIDNDTIRFVWADTASGKGVIYYMKDEWKNECPYDFKNIQFKKSNVFLYTFGGTTDNSLTGGCHHNTIMDYISSYVLTLNFNTFGDECYSNTFGEGCYYNTFGDYCHSNTFGNWCHYNTFGNYCDSNTFGNYCHSNTFGDYCQSNTFGNDCESNTFGDESNSNTFGDYCSSNTFGDWCESNTFGKGFGSNTFGNECEYNNFYHGTSGTNKKNYIRYIVLEDGCTYNNFYSAKTTSSTSYLQRIRIKGLENTAPTNTTITLSTTNTKYDWVIAKNASGVIKQYCPENLVQ